jgi:glycosyltransferase involved in cell wall biosynthesis
VEPGVEHQRRAAWIERQIVGPVVLISSADSRDPIAFELAMRIEVLVSPPPHIDTLVVTGMSDETASLARRVRDGGRIVASLTAGLDALERALAGFFRVTHLSMDESRIELVAERRPDPGPPFGSTGLGASTGEAMLRAELLRSKRAAAASASRMARELTALREERDRLRAAVERTRSSASYQLGRVILDGARPSEARSIPKRLFQIYASRRGDADPHEVPRRHLFDSRLAELVDAARRERAPAFVVLFTGTQIGAIRANRPYALAKVFRDMGMAVVFGYHGKLADEVIPPYRDRLFLDVPSDYLTSILDGLARVDHPRRTLIVSYPIPAVAEALNTFNTSGFVTLYDALDDWEAFASARAARWYSSAAEKLIVSNADATTAVSRPLVEKLQGFTALRSVHLSPNGYDPSFPSAGYAHRPSKEPPKVGYFGHLTAAWLDWKNLFRVAASRPRIAFEIIGYGGPDDVEAAAGRPVPANLHLLGPKDHDELAAIASEWSAAIIPFVAGKLADAVDPIKIYEYLALGLPVVSFRMPQIADYPYTTTVESPEAFAAALDRAISTRVDPARTRSFLEASTWTARAAQLLSIEAELRRAAPYEKTLSSGEP